MSQYCEHEWVTYNSGWTMYEFCNKCGVKKSDSHKHSDCDLKQIEFQALVDKAMAEVKAMELPYGRENKLWKPT